MRLVFENEVYRWWRLAHFGWILCVPSMWRFGLDLVDTTRYPCCRTGERVESLDLGILLDWALVG